MARFKSSVRMIEKEDFPVEQARHYLEPGPITMVSSRQAGKRNVMALGWHVILGFSPSLVGLMISSGNCSHDMVRASSECVINVPTSALLDTVCRVGNTTGKSKDKFAEFGLTEARGSVVDAPLIAECHACFECRLHDDAMVAAYDMFVFEIVKAHVAPAPDVPELLHYTGDGLFRTSKEVISRRELFRPALLL